MKSKGDNSRSLSLGAGRLDRMVGNITQLKYFVAVAEELHFGHAAQRLGMSQPPLSKHIKALETAYGTQLLVRTKRSVKLTPAGQVLLAEARSLLHHADRVGHVMQGAATGNLSNIFLGSVPFALFEAVPAIVQGFRRTAPGVNIVLSEGHTASVMSGVETGNLDFGVVWKNHGDTDFQELAIVSGGFMAALPPSHPLLARPVIDLADLASEPLVVPSRQHSPFHHDRLIASFVDAGLSPKIEYEIPMILSQLGFVASGMAIALVPHVARRLDTFGVEFRPVRDLDAEYKLLLIWREENLSASGRKFLEFVREDSDLEFLKDPR